MAERGRPIPAYVMARIIKLRGGGMSLRQLQRVTNTSRPTIIKYTKKR